MLDDALAVPARSQDRAGTLLIGSVLALCSIVFPAFWLALVVSAPVALVLAPVALAPVALVRGYLLRALAAGARGEPAAPSFVDWAGLARSGVASLAVSAVVTLPAVLPLVAAVAAGTAIRRDLVGVADPELFAGLAALLGLLLAAGWAVVAAYLHPAMQALLATSGFRAALSPRRVVAVALRSRYAVGWVLGVTAIAVGGVVAALTAALLVGLPLGFYAAVVAYSLFGRGTGDAVAGAEADWESGAESEPDSVAEESPPAAPSGTPPEPDPAVQVGRGVGHDGDR